MLAIYLILLSGFIVVWKRVKDGAELKNRIMQVPVRRHTLVWCAAKDMCFGFAWCMFAAAIVIGIMFAMGRLDAADAITCALLAVVIFVSLNIPGIDMLAQLLKTINRIEGFSRLSEGKCLYRFNDAWSYEDADWFILIGKHAACILYAPQIAFSQPVRFDSIAWSVIHATSYVNYIYLRDRKGNPLRMRVPADERIRAWLASHGANPAKRI